MQVRRQGRARGYTGDLERRRGDDRWQRGRGGKWRGRGRDIFHELLGEESGWAARDEHQLGHACEIAIVERQVIPVLGPTARRDAPQRVVDRVGSWNVGCGTGIIDALGRRGASGGRRDNLLGVTVMGVDRGLCRCRGVPPVRRDKAASGARSKYRWPWSDWTSRGCPW